MLPKEVLSVNVQSKIELMLGKDHKAGCKACEELVQLSESMCDLYAYMDQFIEMLQNKNSYVRNRAFELVAALSKWDSENKVDEAIDLYLLHVEDVKPISARQCVKYLPKIAANKPDLREVILNKLRKANTSRYADSMQPLVAKDIADAIERITKM
jgi:hypothetical protein